MYVYVKYTEFDFFLNDLSRLFFIESSKTSSTIEVGIYNIFFVLVYGVTLYICQT